MRLLCCVVLLATHSVQACIQEPSAEAYIAMGRGPVAVDYGELKKRVNTRPESRLERFEEAYAPLIAQTSGTEQQRLTAELAAVRDILTGKYESAIQTLLAVEAAHPGLYVTASTLGTAYELAGDNHSALQWINAGIQRNPESHNGTEWLHARILETKIAMASDPDYLASNPIVPYPERPENGMGNLLESKGRVQPDEDVMNALHYQLGERMLFVKPEDAVVADLLHSYARLEAARFSGEGEAGLMKLARQYGYRDGAEQSLAGRTIGIVTSPRFPGVIVLGAIVLLLFMKLRTW